MGRKDMYFRLLTASFANRRARTATMLAAVVLCAAVISGVTSIYRDIGTQIGKELRRYGANIVALPQAPAKFIDPNLADTVAQSFGKRLVGYSPYLYGRATIDRTEIVIVGTRLDQLKRVSPYLKIRGRAAKGQVLVGRGLAEKLSIAGEDKIRLSFAGDEKEFHIGGFMESGGVEENQVFMELESAQDLLGQPGTASLAHFSVLDETVREPSIVSNKAGDSRLRLAPITRIAQSENQILDKVKTLIFAVAGVVVVTSAMAVATAMMAVVIEQGREVGLKKALGASNSSVLGEFVGEGVAIGLIGGLLGWFLGYLAAQWIGQTVFNAFVSFAPTTAILSVGISIVVALIAMSLPVRLALQVEPATALRGE